MVRGGGPSPLPMGTCQCEQHDGQSPPSCHKQPVHCDPEPGVPAALPCGDSSGASRSSPRSRRPASHCHQSCQGHGKSRGRGAWWERGEEGVEREGGRRKGERGSGEGEGGGKEGRRRRSPPCGHLPGPPFTPTAGSSELTGLLAQHPCPALLQPSSPTTFPWPSQAPGGLPGGGPLQQ